MKEKQPTNKTNGASRPSGKPAKARSKDGRLGPGQLDRLVLAYMREHKGEAPRTASAIGKGIGRSSGAVANCLVRLEKAKEVRLAQPKPRAYKLKGAR
jgi:class 3 adenylate cyclase